MKPFDLTRLGQEIRRRRLDLGWSAAQFAEECGLTPSYFSALEAGQRDPHTTTLITIARGLGCPVSDLLADPDTDLSPEVREIGRQFDQASPHARAVAENMVRVFRDTLQEEGKADDADHRGDDVPRGRFNGGPPS